MPDDRPVNPTLSPNDLEALSAYLDNQLSPTERAALEVRLKAEPALREQVDGLRAVQQALRDLPELRSPRNLTLTTAQARPAKRITVFPSLISGLSAVAAILLIVAGLGILSPGNRPESEQLSVAAVPTLTETVDEGAAPLARAMETTATLGPTTQGAAGNVAESQQAFGAPISPTGEAQLGQTDMLFMAQPSPDPELQPAQESASDSMMAGSAPAASNVAEPAAAALPPQATNLASGGAELSMPAPGTVVTESETTRTKEVTAIPSPSDTPTATATESATPAPTETAVPTPVPVPVQPAADQVAAPVSGLVLIGLGVLLAGVAISVWRQSRRIP
ncbi:MAG: hypothetical protein U0452_11720 [Anaerolineae bacterium]